MRRWRWLETLLIGGRYPEGGYSLIDLEGLRSGSYDVINYRGTVRKWRSLETLLIGGRSM